MEERLNRSRTDSPDPIRTKFCTDRELESVTESIADTEPAPLTSCATDKELPMHIFPCIEILPPSRIPDLADIEPVTVQLLAVEIDVPRHKHRLVERLLARTKESETLALAASEASPIVESEDPNLAEPTLEIEFPWIGPKALKEDPTRKLHATERDSRTEALPPTDMQSRMAPCPWISSAAPPRIEPKMDVFSPIATPR